MARRFIMSIKIMATKRRNKTIICYLVLNCNLIRNSGNASAVSMNVHRTVPVARNLFRKVSKPLNFLSLFSKMLKPLQL